MTSSYRKLQTWGFYPHESQQPLSFYRYKELELPISSLHPKTLSISLPYRLLPGLLQPPELLMLCCVTILSKQMQLQMPCFVDLWKRFLGLSRFRALPSGFYFFGPHLLSSLHSFNFILTIPGFCFWNICSISIMSMRCISKRAS